MAKISAKLGGNGKAILITDATTTAELNIADKVIRISDGNVTGKIDIASQIIYIEDGTGTFAELNVDTGKIDIANADGTLASISLADLVAASQAKFQDVEFLTAGSIFWDGTSLKSKSKTGRFFCVIPGDFNAPEIIDTPEDCG